MSGVRVRGRVNHLTQEWMPRPVDISEPGWIWLDFDFTEATWKALEAAARREGLPVNVWIRRMLNLELRAVLGDVRIPCFETLPFETQPGA